MDRRCNKRLGLIVVQKIDSSPTQCFKSTVTPEAAKDRPVAYFVERGLLMRRRSLPVAAGVDWSVVTQVVVPTPYRQQVLLLAHESPWSGHLGITKTYNGVLQHVFLVQVKDHGYSVLQNLP